MSDKSHRLSANDLRFVYLLIGECCELGADPLIWRRHMLQRLNAFFGAVASVDIEAAFDASSPSTPRVDAAITLDDFSNVEREVMARCMREMRIEDNALGSVLFNDLRQQEIAIGTRQERVKYRDWRNCAFVTEYIAQLGWDESMIGLMRTTTGMRCFNFVRENGQPGFRQRDAKILQLLANELAIIPETRLAPMSGESLLRLPTRLREVLGGMIQGDNETQIAASLRISRNTVHEYVRRLYTRFGVTNRGALLARISRHLHALEFAAGDHGSDYWYFQQTRSASRAG